MLSRFSFFFFAIVVCVSADDAKAQVAVSDLLAEFIAEPLKEMATESSVDISVFSIGSLPALNALRAGEIDLAIVAVPDSGEKISSEFVSYPFAYDTAIVAVNKANPIKEISISELAGIFGSDPDLNLDMWEAIDVTDFGNRLINPLVVRDGDDISTDLFRFSVLRGGNMNLNVEEVQSSEIENSLVATVTSIAVLSHLPQHEAIKVLMVSTNAENPPFGPTEENVYFGDYPIRLPFQIIYAKNNKVAVQELLALLLSDEFADVLRSNHFFVVPDSVRASILSNPDIRQ